MIKRKPSKKKNILNKSKISKKNVSKNDEQVLEEKKELEQAQNNNNPKEELVERPLPSDQEQTSDNTKEQPSSNPQEKLKLNFFEMVEINQEKEYFIENLSILFSSGLNVIDSLESIKSGLKTPSMKKVVDFIKVDIESGEPVWRTLEKTDIFPKHIISLIKVGEDSGRLPENLGLIVVQQQKERMFSSRIKTAMMYPVMVLGLTLVLGVGIAWFVLPKMTSIFGSLNMDLPWITRAMLAIADFMQEYGFIAAPAILISFGSILYVLFFNPKTKHLGQNILLGLPVINRLIQETEISRFGYVFGSLLDAGLPIVNTLDSLKDATDFRVYKQLYASMAKNIQEGVSLQESLMDFKKSQKLIPSPIQHMIMASEKSGNLSETLLNVGKIYEEKLENTTKNLTTLLEPLLLVIVWAGVLVVALSVILPLYSLIGGISQDSGGTESSSPKKMGPKETAVIPAEEPETVALETEEDLPMLKIVGNSEQDSIQIRDYPSQSGEIVGSVSSEETYHFRNQSDNWFEIVIDNDTYGWIEDDYVEIIE